MAPSRRACPDALVYLAALGERTERVALATSVLTPTLRYQPAVIAHDLGFRDLVFHFPGDDQERALIQFSVDVLPRWHDRWGHA